MAIVLVVSVMTVELVFCQYVTKFGGAGRKKRCCKKKMTGDEVRLLVQKQICTETTIV